MTMRTRLITRHFFSALWVVLLPCAFWNPCAKADEAVPQEPVMTNTLTGTVIVMTTRAIFLS